MITGKWLLCFPASSSTAYNRLPSTCASALSNLYRMVSPFIINNSLQDELAIKIIGEFFYLIKEAHRGNNIICKYHPQGDLDSVMRIYKMTWGVFKTNLVLFKQKSSSVWVFKRRDIWFSEHCKGNVTRQERAGSRTKSVKCRWINWP